MNKKVITILGAIFLLILGTVGFLIYQSRGTDKTAGLTPPPPVDETTPPGGEDVSSSETPPTEEVSPPTEQPTVLAVKLTDGGNVISPILFYQGNGVSYFNFQGQLFQADLEFDSGIRLSNTRELTVPLKSGVRKIIWPQAGNNYIVEYELAGKPAWSVYVADRGEYVDLPKQVTAVNWTPLGDKIVYVWLDGQGKSTLNIANPDNTGYQVITDFWESDNTVAVSPDGKDVLFYETNNPDIPNKINIVTADGKVFKSIVKDGYNKGVLWSPDSKKFLFLRQDESSSRFQLWLANLFSGEIKNLEVYTTLDKITWGADSQFVYSASTKATGGDTVYKISLASSELEEFDPGTEVDAAELFLNSTQDWLLFRNLTDNQLYGLPVTR